MRCVALALILSISTLVLAQDPKPAEAPAQVPPAEPQLPGFGENESLSILPTKDKLPLPSVEECLKGPVRDWLVLIKDHVLITEPFDLRPGLLEDVRQKIKAALAKTRTETPEEKEQRLALNFLRLTLVDETEQEYRIPLEYVTDLLYFEDLMLQRVDLLLDEKNVREAFQVLLALERRQRNWPGAVERQNRLLYVEAGVRSEAGQGESALGLLEDLFARDKAYPGFADRANAVVDKLVADSLSREDYREARHFLRRLKVLDPESPVVRRRSSDFLGLAQGELASAKEAEQANQFAVAATHVDQAARYWPETPDLSVMHRRITDRYQRLRVGVWELPRAEAAGSRPITEADRRQQPLVEIPFFRPLKLGRKSVRFEAPLLQGWEPTDLGHSLKVQVRGYRQPWESRPTITAGDLALAIGDRLNPRHRDYDERLAAFVESVSVPSPAELIVQFRSVPLRPEAIFSLPVKPRPAEPERVETAAASGPAAKGGTPETWPFREVERSEQQVTWRRTVPEPDSTAERVERHVTEITERHYSSAETAVQGLLRGEVHMLPRVPAWAVKPLEATNEFYLLRYDLPETHLIHFRPDSPLVRNRELRRVMAYALNRPQILDEVFLRDAPAEFGSVASGLAPSVSYASNPAVVPHKSDFALAISLVPAARKEFEGALPELKMACPADPHIRDAANRLVATWQRLGLTVTLVDETAKEWDICYRVICLAEPLVDLWPALTYPHGTDVASLRTLAPWLREQLLLLDQASDFATAQDLLHRIHAQLWAEVLAIPLWELQPVMAVRKNIRGLSERPLTPYQGVERWRVESWYSRDGM